ncbi:hypothetical protein [Nostoc sp.]|uniref:hypothetical protein n=1 Tax=Nostoc sp. TaxID=1180 RepID=UPI002FFD4E62
MLQGEASGKLGKFFIDFNRGVIDYLNKGLLKLGGLLAVADWSAIGKQLGKVLGVGISDWIMRLDWGALAINALQLIGASIQFQASLIYGAIEGLFANIANTVQSIPTNFAKSIGIPVDNPSVMAGAKAAGDASYGVGKELFKLIPGAGTLFNFGNQQNDNNNRSRPDSLNGAIVTPETVDSTQTPLPTIKTEGGSKQVSFNPSFTINAPAGTDTDGLVALIRNTINNDWNEFKANALA